MKNISEISDITDKVVGTTADKVDKNKGFIISVIAVFIISFLFNAFIVQLAKVNGESMMPNFEPSQLLVVSKISSKDNYKRGDVIIFKYNGKKLIKRLVGLPGEKVQIIDNDIYINDSKIEDYVDIKMTEIENNKLTGEGITLKEGEYIFLGDNRNNSIDSRRFGVVKKKDVIGKVILRFIPFTKY